MGNGMKGIARVAVVLIVGAAAVYAVESLIQNPKSKIQNAPAARAFVLSSFEPGGPDFV